MAPPLLGVLSCTVPAATATLDMPAPTLLSPASSAARSARPRSLFCTTPPCSGPVGQSCSSGAACSGVQACEPCGAERLGCSRRRRLRPSRQQHPPAAPTSPQQQAAARHAEPYLPLIGDSTGSEPQPTFPQYLRGAAAGMGVAVRAQLALTSTATRGKQTAAGVLRSDASASTRTMRPAVGQLQHGAGSGHA